MAWTSRLIFGLLSKEQSIATGLLLSLLIWTLTRVVDGITKSPTIEYDVRYNSTVMADGSKASSVTVGLTNLSGDITIRNLAVTISDPRNKSKFLPTEARCAFPPPMWAEEAECVAYASGLSVVAPLLMPDNTVTFTVKYLGSTKFGERPIVRIRPGAADQKLRVVEPSFVTFIARHENVILMCIFVLTAIFLCASIVAGPHTDPPAKGASE